MGTFALVVAASAIGADPPAAPTVIADGESVTIDGTTYMVQLAGGRGAKAWQRAEAAEGKFAFWHDKKITLYDSKAAAARNIDCPWPLVTLSPSEKLAAVVVHRDANHTQLGIADLPAGKIAVTFPENADGHEWVFSPSGRYAAPLQGFGDFSAADLKEGKAVAIAWPKREGLDEWRSWRGFVTADGKTACIFRWSSQGARTYRAMIPLEAPGEAKIEEDPTGSELFLKQIDGDRILTRAGPKTLLVVSTKNWKMEREIEDDSGAGRTLSGQFSADGKWSYVFDRFKGLTIYDRTREKPVAHGPGRDGWSFNADTLGATFDDKAGIVFLASPYDALLTAMRTKDHSVIGRYAFNKSVPMAGAIVLPAEKAGGNKTLVVVETFLPYE